MNERIGRQDVLRKIHLANDFLNTSQNADANDTDRLIDATGALAQAQLANAYATMLVWDVLLNLRDRES